jgi:vacuolar-type H+-ATPase subunit I/STV1
LGLADHIDDIKDLSAKNKELQEENEKLKERIKALTEGKAVDFSEAGNDNASKRQQFEAQLEAQKKLMEVRPDWKFPDNYGECDENGKPYNFSAVTVTGETGKEISLVLKSYKSHNAKFKINPEEWEWIVKKEAKLLVYTKIHEEFDIVEVPQGDLVMNQSNISISFNSENLDNKKFSEKVSQFAEILHYFTDLHFDFNGFHISGNARRAIDIHAKQSGIQGETTDNDI